MFRPTTCKHCRCCGFAQTDQPSCRDKAPKH